MTAVALLAAAGQAISPAPVADLVAGAQVCATGRMGEQAMHGRIVAAGWKWKAERRIPSLGDARLTRFDRDGVILSYFHARAMKQCIVSAPVDDAFQPDDLLTPLTVALGKPPRADPAGVRYLYALPRLDILTVQIRPADRGRTVELSMVH